MYIKDTAEKASSTDILFSMCTCTVCNVPCTCFTSRVKKTCGRRPVFFPPFYSTLIYRGRCFTPRLEKKRRYWLHLWSFYCFTERLRWKVFYLQHEEETWSTACVRCTVFWTSAMEGFVVVVLYALIWPPRLTGCYLSTLLDLRTAAGRRWVTLTLTKLNHS